MPIVRAGRGDFVKMVTWIWATSGAVWKLLVIYPFDCLKILFSLFKILILKIFVNCQIMDFNIDLLFWLLCHKASPFFSWLSMSIHWLNNNESSPKIKSSIFKKRGSHTLWKSRKINIGFTLQRLFNFRDTGEKNL